MRIGAIVVGAALFGAMAMSSGAIAKPTRTGKVVRVERPRTFERSVLRLCQMENQQIGMASCFGSVPDIGDEAAVYDPNGFQGRVRVTEVKPQQGNMCGGTSGGDIMFEYVEGTGALDMTGGKLAVFGVDTESNARTAPDAYNLKSPSGKYGEQPFLALDRNGDAEYDVIATWYDCVQTAPPNPFISGTTPPSSYSYVYCIDHWTREDSSWERARQDFWYSCM
jgi:hypothetical protein